jgi:hypothetical protein
MQALKNQPVSVKELREFLGDGFSRSQRHHATTSTSPDANIRQANGINTMDGSFAQTN